jgi:hypothetical protein
MKTDAISKTKQYGSWVQLSEIWETPLLGQNSYTFKRHINRHRNAVIPIRFVSVPSNTKSEEDGDSTSHKGAVQRPWIGLPNLETNLQQPHGRNNQNSPAQPI